MFAHLHPSLICSHCQNSHWACHISSKATRQSSSGGSFNYHNVTWFRFLILIVHLVCCHGNSHFGCYDIIICTLVICTLVFAMKQFLYFTTIIHCIPLVQQILSLFYVLLLYSGVIFMQLEVCMICFIGLLTVEQ